MWFFTSLYRSLFDFRWLKERKNNAGASWSYFFLFLFLLAGLTAIPFFLQMPSGLKEMRILAEKNVPDFKAEWKSGELSITQLVQPFVWNEKNFSMVIDTATTTNLQLKNLLKSPTDSGILVTKDRVEIYDVSKNSSRVQFWKDFPDYSITKTGILAYADKWLSPVSLYLISALLFLGIYIGLVISKLFILLFVTILVFIINNLAKKGWTFRQLFYVGLFAMTLPSIALAALSWVGGSISLLYSSILLVILLMVIFVSDKKEIVN